MNKRYIPTFPGTPKGVEAVGDSERLVPPPGVAAKNALSAQNQIIFNIGPGLDFEDLAEAFDALLNGDIGGEEVEFHYGEGEFTLPDRVTSKSWSRSLTLYGENPGTYPVRGCSVAIVGAGKALTTLKLEGDYWNDGLLFHMTEGHLHFRDITIDNEDYGVTKRFLYGHNSIVTFREAAITGSKWSRGYKLDCSRIMAFNSEFTWNGRSDLQVQSHAYFSGCTITQLSSTSAAIEVEANCTLGFEVENTITCANFWPIRVWRGAIGMSCQNNAVGLTLNSDVKTNGIQIENGTVDLNGATITLGGTACVDIANIPVGVMQPSGALLIDGTGSVTNKPLTGTIEKTMNKDGSQDFADFDEVAEWLQNNSFHNAWVKINMPGVGGPYTITDTIDLRGLKGITFLVFSTVDACVVNVSTSIGYMFRLANTSVSFSKVHFHDLVVADNYVVEADDMYLNFSNCTFTDFYASVDIIDRCHVRMSGCTFTLDDSGSDAVSIYGQNNYFDMYVCTFDGGSGSYSCFYNQDIHNTISISGTTNISDFDTIMDDDGTGDIFFKGNIPSGATITNVTTEWPFTKNKIQYDGSYVTDSSVALSFEA